MNPVNVCDLLDTTSTPRRSNRYPATSQSSVGSSQALLLPRCSAVVCHQAGTLIGALASGVPVVCLPRGADNSSPTRSR